MFQLTEEEWENLMPQIATSKIGRGGRRVPPDAFTQEGVAMLSSALNNDLSEAKAKRTVQQPPSPSGSPSLSRSKSLSIISFHWNSSPEESIAIAMDRGLKEIGERLLAGR
jgi:ORF6N domain